MTSNIESCDVIQIHILAGNHESSTMNQMYGFEGEVKAKYPLTEVADM